MREIIFDIQRFAEVLVGKSGKDKLVVAADKTQIYGLAGNDTLESNGKNNILLIGGSGDDILNMTGGTGTLSGGKGSDTFNLSYSVDKKISVVIEDIDPTNDKIFITNDDKDTAQLSYMISGEDIIWTDDKGYFNLTLKGSTDASDYYEGTANEYIWEILRIVNEEREERNLSPLTLAQGLMDATSIREQELVELYSHTRPDGSSCFTAVKKSYSRLGENIAVGQTSPKEVMNSWMNSTGHRANILNSDYKKLGVGYAYDSSSEWKNHWVQMFAGNLNDVETLSADEILTTAISLKGASISTDTAKDAEPIINSESNVTLTGGKDNDNIQSEGANVKIDGGEGNDSITVDKTSDYNWDTRSWEDTYYDKATINGGKGADSITNYNNQAVIDGGEGHDRIFNHGDNVTVHSESGNNFIVNGEFFSKGGTDIKITVGTGNDTIINSGSNSMLDGGAGDDLIYNGYYYYEPWDVFYDDSYNNEHNDKGGSSKVTIEGGTGNDYIKNRGSNILFKYAAGDGNDYIEGFGATDTIGISGSSYSTAKSFNDVIVTVGKNKITLVGASSLSKINIAEISSDTTPTDTTPADTSSGGGSEPTLLSVTDSTKSPVTVDSSIKIIDASKRTSVTKITGNSLDNAIKGGGANDTITGEAGADSIFGGAGDDKLSGNNGKDSLWGGAGNDTLTGGNGKDFFIYSGGNDVITDYAVTEKISLGANISDTALNGLDVILTTDAGTLTIKKAKGKNLNLINPAGKSFSTMVGVLTNLTVTNLTKSPVTVGSAIKTVTAASRTKAAKISGNALDNTMTGGKGNDTLLGGAGDDSIFGNTGNDTLRGGAGNDTLLGGKGNDMLWGNAGADVFIYESGDGQDVIFGFENEDMLQITGNFSSTYESSKREIYFAVDSTSNALTLKNFTATTFNINGTNYKISGADLIRN